MGKLKTDDKDEVVLYSPNDSSTYSLIHTGNLALKHVPTSKVPERGLVSGRYYNFGTVTNYLALKFLSVKEGYVGIWQGEFILDQDGQVVFPFNVKWPEDTPKQESGYRYLFQVLNNIGRLTKVAV